MTSTVAPHPIVGLADAACARFEQVASRPVWSMTVEEQRTALDSLAVLASQVEALRLRVVAEADRSGAVVDLPKPEVRLARSIESRPLVDAGLVDGSVRIDQAKVIVAALEKLPTFVTTEQVEAAEQFLVDHAAHHTARELKRLGSRLFEVIAFDQADEIEGKILEAQEARAWSKTSFSMWEDEHGTCHGTFAIPHLHGQMLTKALFALGEVSDEPVDVRRGHAFTRLLESVSEKDLPSAGGCGATVVVTMTLDQLQGANGTCTLDTGGRLSAADARRIACGSKIIPMVLGGEGQVLDVGKGRRFHTKTQRIVLARDHGGCSAVGCDKPPAMCHAHHDVPWSNDGPTSVDNGRLLCGTHHRRIHDQTWRHERRADGRVEFHRRNLGEVRARCAAPRSVRPGPGGSSSAGRRSARPGVPV